ncbi:MAG: glycoside hydrolase family 31 protein [Pigmentiphaga sp.]|nr:glycoside hydrolase family 31 protein [Pigmentiphaga sp.]
MRDSTTILRSRYRDLGRLTQHEVNSSTFQFATAAGWPLIVEACAPGVFRCTIAPPEAGGADAIDQAAALLARDEAVSEAELAAQDGGWLLTQGEVVLQIETEPLRLTLIRDQQTVLRLGSEDQPAIAAAEAAGGDDGRWCLSLQLDGAALHGLGESTVSQDRRGSVLVSDDPSHRVLPLAWSPQGWGVHVNTLHRVVHDAAATDDDTYLIEVAGPRLDVFLYAGEPADIFNQYSQIVGRAGQPPLWSLGLWLRQPPEATPAEALAVAQRLREQGVGIEVLGIDPPSALEVRAKQASEWDATRFPDSKAWLQACQAAEVRVCLPVYPGVPYDSPAMLDLEDRGWLLTGDDGLARSIDTDAVATGASAVLDLTHRDVYNSWCERNRQVFDEGVDAMASLLPSHLPDDIEARNRASGVRLRQLYPLLATRNLFDAAAWHKVPPEGLVWHRDLSPVAHRFPLMAGPAVPNTWEGLEASLTAALTAGASGLAMQSHEIGSQEFPVDELTPELYLRWLTVGVFSAHLRLQGLPALLPDAFDDDTRARIDTWLQWRYRLVPYVLGAIEDAARTGLPVQRSMALAFPEDPEAYEYTNQYLLGPALLVAPLLESGDETVVYFPEGEAWWDLATGWRYEGGTAWIFPCPHGEVPVFGREGHMLCLGTGGRTTADFNSARLLEEVWLFGMPQFSPTVMRNKIRVMQMQGSSYIKGLEGLRILPSEGLEVKRRGAEVRISRAR